MMPEDNPLIADHIISSVLQSLRRRSPKGVKRQHLGCNELAVEAVGESVAAGRTHHQPHRIDGLAAAHGDHSDRERAQQSHCNPEKKREGLFHISRALWRIFSPRAIPVFGSVIFGSVFAAPADWPI